MKRLITILLLFSLVAASLFGQSNADEPRTNDSYYLNKGDKQINLNLGFLNTTNFAFSLFGATGAGDPSPALNLEFDYGVSDFISIGAFTGFYKVDASSFSNLDEISGALSGLGLDNEIGSIFSDLGIDGILCETLGIGCPEDVTTEIQERINVFSFGGKLMFRRPLVEQLDTYASTYLGYSINKRKTITEQALDAVSNEVGLNTEVPSLIYFGSVGARYYATPKLGIYAEYGAGNVHLLKAGISYKL